MKKRVSEIYQSRIISHSSSSSQDKSAPTAVSCRTTKMSVCQLSSCDKKEAQLTKFSDFQIFRFSLLNDWLISISTFISISISFSTSISILGHVCVSKCSTSCLPLPSQVSCDLL